MWLLYIFSLSKFFLFNGPDSDISLIRNFSFEEGPVGCCQVPPSWDNCGSEGETAPDIHCDLCANPFGVSMPAPHGKQFLAMVVRSNGTKECLEQELREPLLATQKYRLHLYLGRSPVFNSMDRITQEPASYSTLSALQIYGMSSTGYVMELGVIRPFSGIGWTEYNLLISPEKEIAVIIFELTYLGRQKVYNGHLLLDYMRLKVENDEKDEGLKG